jgi:hypothetical protein
MRRLPGQSLRIGVSGYAVSLLRTSRWGGAKVTLLAEEAFSPEDAGVRHVHHAIGLALRELLAGHDVAGWPVAFVLADELTRLWQVTPPVQATRKADLEGAAALRFFSLYGEPAADWSIAADWDTEAPFFASAVPRPLLATLQQTAVESRMAVVQVVPHFVTAWNRWQGAIKPGAWFGQVHDKLLTLAVIDGRRLHAVRALPLPQGAGHDWLSEAVRREALLAGVETPALLQLCGQVPPALARPAAGAGQLACMVLVVARPEEDAWSLSSILARGGLAA